MRHINITSKTKVGYDSEDAISALVLTYYENSSEELKKDYSEFKKWCEEEQYYDYAINFLETLMDVICEEIVPDDCSDNVTIAENILANTLICNEGTFNSILADYTFAEE